MDLADELERRGLGVKVKGTWMGACFFADDIVLMTESGKELQCMLDVVYKYANRWKLRQVNVGYWWWDRRKVGSCGL